VESAEKRHWSGIGKLVRDISFAFRFQLIASAQLSLCCIRVDCVCKLTDSGIHVADDAVNCRSVRGDVRGFVSASRGGLHGVGETREMEYLPMPHAATIKNVPALFRMVKARRAEGVEWGENDRRAARRALAKVLEIRMGQRRSSTPRGLPTREWSRRGRASLGVHGTRAWSAPLEPCPWRRREASSPRRPAIRRHAPRWWQKGGHEWRGS